jgi:hypothetical protein
MTAQSGRIFPASEVVAPKTPPVSLPLLAAGLRRRDENWSAYTMEPKVPIETSRGWRLAGSATSFCLDTVARAELGGGMPLAFGKHQ